MVEDLTLNTPLDERRDVYAREETCRPTEGPRECTDVGLVERERWEESLVLEEQKTKDWVNLVTRRDTLVSSLRHTHLKHGGRGDVQKVFAYPRKWTPGSGSRFKDYFKEQPNGVDDIV